jgi:hypothetical protein
MLRQLPVPVLTVSHLDQRTSSQTRFRPAGNEFSMHPIWADSDAGLQFAIRLARGLDAHLTAAHVIDLEPGFPMSRRRGYRPTMRRMFAQAESISIVW